MKHIVIELKHIEPEGGLALKRLASMLCLLALLVLSLPCAAQAVTITNAEDWNLYCLYIVQDSVPVYELTIQEIADGAEDLATGTDLTYVFTPIDTIASPIRVMPTGEQAGGKAEIAYWRGSRRYGYVDASAIIRSSRSITGSNGKTYELPSNVISNDALLRRSIILRYSEDDVDIVLAALAGDSTSGSGGENGGEGWTAPKSADTITLTLMDEDGTEQPVTLLTPGTAVSEIRIDGETLTVPTASLRWGSTAPEDKQLAVITAPKGGEAALRAKASSKGQVLKKCQTNRIVLVLSVGKSYARVYCDGLVGYIRNSSLTFYPVGGVKEGGSAPTPGWVSFRGRLNSKNTVNIRQSGKNGSRILTDFIAGTPVMVFSQTDRWAEIDVGGYRAYILNEYLTLDTAPQGE